MAARTSPICDSFELQIQGDAGFCVVGVPEPAVVPVGSFLPSSNVYGIPQLRPGPGGRPCVVYRRSPRHLEVDVPAAGVACRKACPELLCTFFPAVVTPTVFLVLGLLGDSPPLWITGLAVFICMIAAFAYLYIQTALGHTNFIITPTNSRQKMVLEFRPRFRDSVSNPNEAMKRLTLADWIFGRQLEGSSLLLTEAKTDKAQGEDRQSHSALMLVETSGFKHALNLNLSPDQHEWIACEINEVLRNIRHWVINV